MAYYRAVSNCLSDVNMIYSKMYIVFSILLVLYERKVKMDSAIESLRDRVTNRTMLVVTRPIQVCGS
jgi:hypothetical protein